MTRYVREDVLLTETSMTCEDDDEVCGCAGIIELWAGVYEAWFAIDESYATSHNTPCVIFILRSLNNSLNALFDNKEGLHIDRVHAFVSVNTPNYERFMEFLKFEKEALLTKFFPDKSDCVVYRRMR